jgi:hypothetical protein
MDAASCECVCNRRGRCCQRLAFPSGHFGNGPVSQDETAEQLNIMKRFSMNPTNRFDGHGKGGFQNLRIQDISPRLDLFSEVLRFRGERGVAFSRQAFGVGPNRGDVRSLTIRPKESAMKRRSIV